MDLQLPHPLKDQPCDQQRTSGMQRRHAAIEVIVRLFSGGQHKVAAA
jgi:hypothetical protein